MILRESGSQVDVRVTAYIGVESCAQAMASSSSGGPSSIPRDALVMAAILKEMGVADYEPRVINLMLEFAYSEIAPPLFFVR